jgi:hypothetical protein
VSCQSGNYIRDIPKRTPDGFNTLQPFSAVKNLYPRENTLPILVFALKEVPEERVTELLPDFPWMPLPPAVQEAIERLIGMRRLSTARGATSC